MTHSGPHRAQIFESGALCVTPELRFHALHRDHPLLDKHCYSGVAFASPEMVSETYE